MYTEPVRPGRLYPGGLCVRTDMANMNGSALNPAERKKVYVMEFKGTNLYSDIIRH